jgi:hypothetical protein
MKNILVIDRAENCSFSICLVNEEDFALIFPNPDQDVEFIEDLTKRVGKIRAGKLVQRSTARRIRKRDAMGIHGTLFFDFPERRKYFPNKREDDIDMPRFYLKARSPKR